MHECDSGGGGGDGKRLRCQPKIPRRARPRLRPTVLLPKALPPSFPSDISFLNIALLVRSSKNSTTSDRAAAGKQNLTGAATSHPILAIQIGAFVANCNQQSIAILHPKHLVFYTLQAVGGTTAGSANYFKLIKKFEHQLGVDGEHFTAFNMTTGPFGSSTGKFSRECQFIHIFSIRLDQHFITQHVCCS